MMNLTINGKITNSEEGITVATLLDHLHIQTGALAIAVNLEVIPKNRYADTYLKEGDNVELLTPLAGG
jgi:sulfur carrier protein